MLHIKFLSRALAAREDSSFCQGAHTMAEGTDRSIGEDGDSSYSSSGLDTRNERKEYT